MTNLAIVGIGNPFRGDDGAGWAVIDALGGKVTADVALLKLRGEITELLDALANYSSIYFVDACRMDGATGAWKRIDALVDPIPPDHSQTSTHGLSLAQAITLAKTLDQLPSKLIIYAINGNQYSISNTLSFPVAEAIEPLTQELLNEEEIQACMKKA